MDRPSTLGLNRQPFGGRDGQGRFAAGNRLGSGNPLAGRAAKIRAALLDKMDADTTSAVCDALIGQAKGGDLAAIRELLDRTAGKPTQADLLDRLEALEAALLGGNPNEHRGTLEEA